MIFEPRFSGAWRRANGKSRKAGTPVILCWELYQPQSDCLQQLTAPFAHALVLALKAKGGQHSRPAEIEIFVPAVRFCGCPLIVGLR
jgi:hypothetical protein